MRRSMIVVSVALAIGLTAQDAFAQQRSTGGRTTGAGASGQPAFQVGGRTGAGLGEAGNFGVGTAGQVDTNARYLRENRQGAFVGADTGDTGFVGNAAAGNTRTGSSSRNIRRGGGGQTNVNQGGRGRGRQREEVRMVLQLGFTPPKPSTISPARAPEAVASQLARRMERSTWIQNRSPLQVSIDQGTATLRGVVASEHDRVLAERLALLEGGISKVENLLKVEPTTPDSLEPPAELQPVPETATD